MRTKYVCLAVFLLFSGILFGEEKKIAEIKKEAGKHQIEEKTEFTILYPEGFSSDGFQLSDKHPFFPDDPCTARMVGSSYWAIDGWLAGDELYKVYQDIDLLANDCSYPFYVTAVAIQLQTTYSGTLYLQADVEALDESSTDACPYPGELLGITEENTYEISGEGNYVLVVVFDEPVLVDTAYFAGIYFGAGASDLVTALVTDNDPYLCVSWNDWGLGYVDLISNPYYNFPGNLVMFSYGYNAEDPEPSSGPTMLYSPRDSSTVGGDIDLYSAELTDTIDYDYCSFEYYGSSSWTIIGEDNSPDVTLRNSSSSATVQPGYYRSWDASSLAEDWYDVRAIYYSGGSEISGDTISVYVDNTPIKPVFTNPLMLDNVCDTITINVDVTDEDASLVQFELRGLSDTVTMDWALLDQFDYGDMDGDSDDGNSYAYGEYGDFYNGPTIATSAFKYFSDNGYTDLMAIDGVTQTVTEMVEACADSMNVRDRLGTEDDNFIAHIKRHIEAQGQNFLVETVPEFESDWLIFSTAYRLGLVMFGISEPIGYWLGVSELIVPDHQTDTIECKLYDTRNAAYLDSRIVLTPSCRLEYGGTMYDIDRAIAIYPRVDTTSRKVIGGDYDASDGFSLYWESDSYSEGAYMLAAVGMDSENHVDETVCAIRLMCDEHLPGDVNLSDFVDIDDIIYLISYLFQGGPAPDPEEFGDINCTGFTDIDDIIYLISYLFQGGPAPEPC